MKRHILITTNHMRNLAGSEIVTLELIEYFLLQDWMVDLYTHDLGEPVLTEIKLLPDWGRLRILVAQIDEPFEHDYDLVWVHHSIVPDGLIDRLVERGLNAPMIWHHMSSFMDVELPRNVQIENKLASLTSAMSLTALDTLEEFGIKPENLFLFDNPAPDVFADYPERPRDGLSKMLVVSNHAPTEVRDGMRLLEEAGVDISFLGVPDGPRRVTPELLDEFDAVLSIGKTVPYALSLGIPVYVYDHFGGPGWLSPDNLESAAADTFSGRKSSRTITGDELAEEVHQGYGEAARFAKSNRVVHAERWRLSAKMREIIELANVDFHPPVGLTRFEGRQLKSLIALHRDLYRLLVAIQFD